MLYLEFLIDGAPYELELHPGMVYTKCAKCGQKIYGYIRVGDETEMLCEACTPPPPDPKKMIIENLEKHLGVIFTEEEMDYWMKKATLICSLRRYGGDRKHPSVRSAIIPL